MRGGASLRQPRWRSLEREERENLTVIPSPRGPSCNLSFASLFRLPCRLLEFHCKRQTLRLETAIPSNNTSSPNGNLSFSTVTNTLGSSRNNSSSIADETYVMWMGVGETNGTLGMSAVATSHHPDGPFSLRRTLYPDGNETRDQTVFIGQFLFLEFITLQSNGSP